MASKRIVDSPPLRRSIGLLQAGALNMNNMVGIGPFITIPILLGAMGGPQAMLGWVVGMVIALADGLVWSELGGALPGSGGTFVYLREGFAGTRLGRVLPFLFIWQFILSGPLEIASGTIGFAQYLGYVTPLSPSGAKLIAAALAVLATALLYRGVGASARLAVVMWRVMLATVAAVIVVGLLRFDPRVAFDLPPSAFDCRRAGFWLGLGGATLVAMYDYLGYYNVCYLGDEVRDPGRTIPRAVMLSVAAVAAIYAAMNLSLVGTVPWREMLDVASPAHGAPASVFMERAAGRSAALALTAGILVTAFASVLALLLGYSRIPYAAAREGFFFAPFARVHSRAQFPHVSLVVIGAAAAVASFLPLLDVITAAVLIRIAVQFLGQIAALVALRRRRPELPRPYRMWGYPLPALVAAAGWAFILYFGAQSAPVLHVGPLEVRTWAAVLALLGGGLAAFFVWARAGTASAIAE